MKLNKEDLNKLIGQNIRVLRQSKGYTIEKLALEANIESKQLRRIELGEVNTSIYQIYNLLFVNLIVATNIPFMGKVSWALRNKKLKKNPLVKISFFIDKLSF